MRVFAVALCFVLLSIAVFGQAGTGTITCAIRMTDTDDRSDILDKGILIAMASA